MLSAPEHTVRNTMSPGVSLYLNPVACNNKRKKKEYSGERSKEITTEKMFCQSKKTQTHTMVHKLKCAYIPTTPVTLAQTFNKNYLLKVLQVHRILVKADTHYI